MRAYDASGALLAFYAATIGSEHDPLPLGEWKINGVARGPKFHYNAELFWDAKDTTDKATLAAGSQQSGRAGMDRFVQGPLRNSRYAGAR